MALVKVALSDFGLLMVLDSYAQYSLFVERQS
jgi:hypothetical protein